MPETDPPAGPEPDAKAAPELPEHPEQPEAGQDGTATDPHRAELEAIFGRIRAIPDREIGTVVRFLRTHGY